MSVWHNAFSSARKWESELSFTSWVTNNFNSSLLFTQSYFGPKIHLWSSIKYNSFHTAKATSISQSAKNLLAFDSTHTSGLTFCLDGIESTSCFYSETVVCRWRLRFCSRWNNRMHLYRASAVWMMSTG